MSQWCRNQNRRTFNDRIVSTRGTDVLFLGSQDPLGCLYVRQRYVYQEKILVFDMRCFTSIHDGVFSSFWVRVLRNCTHGERLYNDVTLISKICLWSNFSYGKKFTYEVLCIYELGPCKEQSDNQMLDIGSYYIGFWYMRTETVGNWQNERANDTLSYMCSKQLTRFCICIRQLGLIILLRFGNCLISFC